MKKKNLIGLVAGNVIIISVLLMAGCFSNDKPAAKQKPSSTDTCLYHIINHSEIPPDNLDTTKSIENYPKIEPNGDIIDTVMDGNDTLKIEFRAG